MGEKLPVISFGRTERRLWNHVDGLMFRIGLALSRAYFDTEPATRTILRRDLQRVLHRFKFAPPRLRKLESGRCILQQRVIVDLRADHGVWTHEHALSA